MYLACGGLGGGSGETGLWLSAGSLLHSAPRLLFYSARPAYRRESDRLVCPRERVWPGLRLGDTACRRVCVSQLGLSESEQRGWLHPANASPVSDYLGIHLTVHDVIILLPRLFSPPITASLDARNPHLSRRPNVLLHALFATVEVQLLNETCLSSISASFHKPIADSGTRPERPRPQRFNL